MLDAEDQYCCIYTVHTVVLYIESISVYTQENNGFYTYVLTLNYTG